MFFVCAHEIIYDAYMFMFICFRAMQFVKSVLCRLCEGQGQFIR